MTVRFFKNIGTDKRVIWNTKTGQPLFVEPGESVKVDFTFEGNSLLVLEETPKKREEPKLGKKGG